MHNPTLDITALQSLLPEESINVFSQMLYDRVRHFRREHDMEAFFGNIPAHHAFGVGVEDRFGRQNFGAFRFPLRANYNRGGRAISEKQRRNQMSHRQIVPLERERPKLTRKSPRPRTRIAAHVTRRARYSRRTGDAA